MQKIIKAEILINATPQKVWSILTDFYNYPNWNLFITSVKGKIEIGNKITVRFEPPQSRQMTFKPKILKLEENKELIWSGHFLFEGIFDGEHKFKLIDKGNGTTHFIQSEKFKGLLVPFFKSQIENNTKNGFDIMNKKLKELAEA